MTRFLRIALLGAVAAAALSTGAASAAPMAVLGTEALGATEAQAQAVTEAVRKAAKGRPGVELMPGKDFVELRFLFGCTDEATLAPCMAQAGRSLVADFLVAPTLRSDTPEAKQAGKVELSLRLLDVAHEKFTREVHAFVEPARLGAGAVDATVAPLVEQLLSATPASLETPVASSETATTKEPEHVETPAPATPPPVSSKGSRGRSLKIAGGVALALAVVAAGVAIYGGVHVASLETDGASDLKQTIAASPVYADEQRAWFNATSGCTAPGAPPSSAQGSLAAFQQHCGDGHAWANATTAMWVVSGALAAGGLTAILLGAKADLAAPSEKPSGKATRERSRLVVVPALGPSGGGLSATLSF